MRQSLPRLRRGTSAAARPLLLRAYLGYCGLIVSAAWLTLMSPSSRCLRVALPTVVELLLKLIEFMHEVGVLAPVHGTSQHLLHHSSRLLLFLVLLSKAAPVVLCVVDTARASYTTLSVAGFSTALASGAARVLAG